MICASCGYRELIYFLTWRDIKVRYKRATLGIAWAILQPMLTTAITSLVLVICSRLIPVCLTRSSRWRLCCPGTFQLSLQKSSISLVGNAT